MNQSQALDILTRNAGEVARRVQARDLGGGVILALFRMVKLATLHAIDDQAMVRQVEETVHARDYASSAVRAYLRAARAPVGGAFGSTRPLPYK